MNDEERRSKSDAPPAGSLRPSIAEPRVRRASRFSLVWLIPLIAVLVGAYLGWRTLSQEGRTITITFNSADGLTAGQTKIRHKAVDLGTVQSIELAHDMSHVVVKVAMRREADEVLTDQARFWVVKPRLTAGSISGLETLVSGSYIEMDPGRPDGKSQSHYTGLEQPPAVRSDEPGTTFDLRAIRLGSLASGSPVFYRDVQVGEVLGYNLGEPGEPVTIHVFVRAPFDKYVHEGSYFWNASGLSLEVGAEGVKLQLESIQAVLAGGVAFITPKEAEHSSIASAGSEFQLFRDYDDAVASHYKQRLQLVAHFHGSVAGLASNAPVMMYGIQVGNVTSVRLTFDPEATEVDVPVTMELEPERIAVINGPAPPLSEGVRIMSILVKRGMRAQLHSANLLTGQQVVALDFFPDATPAEISVTNGVITIPTEPTDLENISRTVSDLSKKLQKMPLDSIAQNINATLESVHALVAGPELRATLLSMTATLNDTQDMVRKLDAGLTPALRRLPDIAQELQATLTKAGQTLGSLNGGYGENSQFRRELERLIAQVSDAARSVGQLASLLDQHPEALIRGRSGSTLER